MRAKPTPPDVLAEYVVDALDRQNIEKLHAVEEYARELRAYKRELEEEKAEQEKEEVLDDPDVEVEEAEGNSYFVIKRQKCGADCECNDGKGHGPYKWKVKPQADGPPKWECIENVSEQG